MAHLDSTPTTVGTGAAHRVRRGFFFAIAAAILAIVLVGFAPTLYLRGLFDPPPIPAYLYVHGAVLTTWFALVVTQTTLIRRGSVAMHRRLGVVGIGVAVAVVLVSAVVTLRFVDRVLHAPSALDRNMSVVEGFGSDPPLLGLGATALWGDLSFLLTFTVLVGSAVLMRRRGDVHKRLMVLASMSILPPAIARISRWPGLGGDLGPLVPIVMFMLLGGMVGFDLRTRRRIHWATLAGGGFVVLSIVVSSVVAKSSFGLSVARALG